MLELALHLGSGDGAAQLDVELVDDGAGQFGGAGEPGPGDDLESGMPCSATVGTSGKSRQRALAVTASARTRRSGCAR
jgi:hypothetical protein